VRKEEARSVVLNVVRYVRKEEARSVVLNVVRYVRKDGRLRWH
jgi:hypothetical protein